MNHIRPIKSKQLLKRQHKEVLDYLQTHGYITNQIVQEILEVKQTRAYVIIREMVNGGLIAKHAEDVVFPHHRMHWDSSHVLHAELLTLDDSGVPVLLLVIDELHKGGDNIVDWLIVAYYNGETVEVIYRGFIGGEGGFAAWYEVVTTRSGRKYLVSYGYHGFYLRIAYRTLRNGEIVTILERDAWFDDYPGDNANFYENGNSITEEEFNVARANLDVMDRRLLSWRTLYDRMDMYEFVKTFADWR